MRGVNRHPPVKCGSLLQVNHRLYPVGDCISNKMKQNHASAISKSGTQQREFLRFTACILIVSSIVTFGISVQDGEHCQHSSTG